MPNCITCGSAIQRQGVRGRRPLYCSGCLRPCLRAGYRHAARYTRTCVSCGRACMGHVCCECPRIRTMVPCNVCGAWFWRKPTNTLACSPACIAKRRERPEICCRGCSVMFTRRGGSGKYCTRQCAFAHWSEIRKSSRPRVRRPRITPPPVCRPCKYCGQVCETSRQQMCRRGPCWFARHQRNYSARRQRRGRLPLPKPMTCFCCGGNIVHPALGRGRPRLFCSKVCTQRMSKYAHFWSGHSGGDILQWVAAAAMLKAVNRVRYALNSGSDTRAIYIPTPASE